MVVADHHVARPAAARMSCGRKATSGNASTTASLAAGEPSYSMRARRESTFLTTRRERSVAALVVRRHVDSLRGSEGAHLRQPALARDLDFNRAAREHVATPVRSPAEARDHDGLARRRLPRQDLEDRAIPAPRATASMRETQEAVSEDPAGIRAIHRCRQTKQRRHSTIGHPRSLGYSQRTWPGIGGATRLQWWSAAIAPAGEERDVAAEAGERGAHQPDRPILGPAS